MTDHEEYKALCRAQWAAEGEWQARIDNQRRKFPFTPGWFEARRLKREAYERFLEAHERVEEALERRFNTGAIDRPYPNG